MLTAWILAFLAASVDDTVQHQQEHTFSVCHLACKQVPANRITQIHSKHYLDFVDVKTFFYECYFPMFECRCDFDLVS